MSAVFACIVQAKVIEFSVADHKLHRAQKDEELLQELLALSLPSPTSGDPQADTAEPKKQQPPKQQQQQVKGGTSDGMAASKAGSQHPSGAGGGGGGSCEVATQAGGGCRVLWRGHGTSMASVGTAVCVFEGKLSNARALAETYAPVPEEVEEESGEAGAVKGTRGPLSAAELVCHMYGKVGVDLLGLLRGTFTFVLYESKTGRVLAARDGCGVCPLFQSRTQNGSLVLSNSRQLLEGLGAGGTSRGSGAGSEEAGGDGCGGAGGSDLLEILPGDYKYGWSAVPRRYQPPDRRSSFQSHPIGSPSNPSAHWPIHNRPGSRRASLDQHAHPHSPNGQRFRPTDSVNSAVACPIVGSAPSFGSDGGGGSLGARGAPRGRSSMDQQRPTHLWHKNSTDGTVHVTGAGVGSSAAAGAAMLPTAGQGASLNGGGVAGAGTAASPHHPHGHHNHLPQAPPHRTYVISADGSRIRKVPKKNANGNKSQQQQHPRQQRNSGSDSGGVAGSSAAEAGGVLGGGAVSALSAALAAASVSDRSQRRAAAPAAVPASADAGGGGRVARTGRHGGQGEGAMNGGCGAGGGGNNRRRSTEVQNGGWRTGPGAATQNQVVANGSVSFGAHLGRRQFGEHDHHQQQQQQQQGQQSASPAAPQSLAKQPQQKGYGGQQRKSSEQLNGAAAATTSAAIWIGKSGSSPVSGGSGDSSGVGVWKAKVGSTANEGGGGARARTSQGAATVAAPATAAGGAPLSSTKVGSRSPSVSSGGSVNEPGLKGRKTTAADANGNGNHVKEKPEQQSGPQRRQQQLQQQQGGGAQCAATDRMSGPSPVLPEAGKPEAGVIRQCGGGGGGWGEGVAVAVGGGGSGAGGLRVEAPEFKPQWVVSVGAPTAMGRAPAAAVVGAVEGLMAVAGASM